jgi:hypothetical protein
MRQSPLLKIKMSSRTAILGHAERTVINSGGHFLEGLLKRKIINLCADSPMQNLREYLQNI